MLDNCRPGLEHVGRPADGDGVARTSPADGCAHAVPRAETTEAATPAKATEGVTPVLAAGTSPTNADVDDVTSTSGGGARTRDRVLAEAETLRDAAMAVSLAVTPKDVRDLVERAQTHAASASAAARAAAGVALTPSPAQLQLYWALGAHKWREAVDGRHWEYGPRVYDFCLHKGNMGHIDPVSSEFSLEARSPFACKQPFP